jgi:DNA-binding NarL/FixJ family response regulator
MITVAIYAADPDRRRHLEQMLVSEPSGFSIAGASADEASLTTLLQRHAVDVVIADAPPHEALLDWHQRFAALSLVVLVSDAAAEAMPALQAGARAVLPATVEAAELSAAVHAAARGLAVLPRSALATLLALEETDPPAKPIDGGPELTPRELDVLTAMADGASNKVIARRLGISYHTVKFHVAAILTKLDADTRTEAVARAAHLGLVML